MVSEQQRSVGSLSVSNCHSCAAAGVGREGAGGDLGVGRMPGAAREERAAVTLHCIPFSPLSGIPELSRGIQLVPQCTEKSSFLLLR